MNANMEIVLLLLTFVFYTYQLEIHDPVIQERREAVHVECMKESGATLDEVNSHWTPAIYDASDNLKCYLKCASLKMNVMDESGNINFDIVQKIGSSYLNVTLNGEILDNCIDAEEKDKTDLCAVAYSLFKCLVKIMDSSGAN